MTPKKVEHSKKEEPGGSLSGKIIINNNQEKAKNTDKKSSPTVRRATLDELSGKCSPVSSLSGNTKILEKSYP